MKKKIDVMDLQFGMYVSELDRPWLDSPFMFQGFAVTTRENIDQLKHHCRYVFIDVEKGADVPQHKKSDSYDLRMQVLEETEKKTQQKVRELARSTGPTRLWPKRKSYVDQTTFEEEIVRAREIGDYSRAAMRASLDNIRKGKNIDLALANKVVGNMVDSIIRNPDALVCLNQLKDVSEYAALHSIRSCIIGLAFGRHLAFSREELKLLGLGLLMHDIGMVKVPEEILHKSSGLDVKEFEIMQKHIPWGLEVLEKSGDIPAHTREVVEQHHERFDGAGYPANLAGEAITLFGNIGAIVDVYDAVTSRRNYSEGLSAEDALKRMYEWREKDFNGELVEEFIKCMGIFPIGSLVELSTGSIGVVITINRARRLKPKVAMVLTANKTPFSYKTVTDLVEHQDTKGEEIKIKRVLPTGSYDINPMDHITVL